MINLIVAMDKDGGIGKDGKLPWHYPEDLKHFKKMTNGCDVVMGRKTFDSIIDIIGKPLPNRISYVLTNHTINQQEYYKDTCFINDDLLYELLESHQYGDKNNKKLWVIGGYSVYNYAIKWCDKLYITRINKSYNCDTFFPKSWSGNFWHKYSSDFTNDDLTLEEWVNIN